jgi:hypothetical protein
MLPPPVGMEPWTRLGGLSMASTVNWLTGVRFLFLIKLTVNSQQLAKISVHGQATLYSLTRGNGQIITRKQECRMRYLPNTYLQ